MGQEQEGARNGSRIAPFGEAFADYAHDESRTTGTASSISFPTSEADVRSVLAQLRAEAARTGTPPVPVTVQGARTGLAAGAVPHGGHIMNLSRMNRVRGLRRDDTGAFFLRVEPGVVLQDLRKQLARRTFATVGWDDASVRALEALAHAPAQFFPTDPTETTATLGGMAACNASGARSYRYGALRAHVSALRVVLADGDTVALRRGEQRAHGRTLMLTTEQGTRHRLDLPRYVMPRTKNASGYYCADDMDALDLFIGSDGTLGIITELELALMPEPAFTWGVSCFFPSEATALAFVEAARPELGHAVAFEYIDGAALAILRAQRARGAAFKDLPEPPADAACCVYVELAGDDRLALLAELTRTGELLDAAGASAASTWVARTAQDRERQRLFRHAVPESVNMLIDERRRRDPVITKLGSDMSVPNDRLRDVMALYRRTIAARGLESAAWGHIGNNHLHVNLLPRTGEEYAQGVELFRAWAQAVTEMGGAVSAEHGVGKLKRDFLAVMYGEGAIRAMARLKLQLDPEGILGRGSLIPEAVLEDVRAEGGVQR